MAADPLAGRISFMATMICVADLEQSLDFYRDRLRFQVRESAEHIALIHRDGVFLYLFLESPPTPDKPGVWMKPPGETNVGSVILCFRVDDSRAAYKALVEAGVGFMTPPSPAPGGGWRCFARDPDGYVVEIEDPPT